MLTTEHITGISISDAIDEYRAFYARGDSKTASAKRYDLDHFEHWLASRRALPVESVTTEDIREFLTHRLKVDAPSTADRRLSTVRHLFNFIAAKYPGYYPPTKGVKGPHTQKLTPRCFSAEQIKDLEAGVEELFDDEFKRRRLEVLLALGRRAGLRVGELKSVTIGQIDVLTRTLTDLHRKAHRFQSIPLDAHTMEAILAYLPVREEVLRENDILYFGRPHISSYPLIVSLYGAIPGRPDSYALSTKAIYSQIRLLGEAKGIKAHPHKLRHTFCREFLEVSGGDIALTAEAAGHSDINTTRLYLTQGIDRIREVQNRRLM